MDDAESLGMIFVWIVIYAVRGIIFGILSKKINEGKGYYGGFAWGFFLGVIGMLIVASKPDKKKKNNFHNDGISGSTAGNEGTWKCSQCNRVNPDRFTICTACGRRKADPLVSKPKTKQCSNCGAWNGENHQFCISCGSSLTGTGGNAAVQNASEPEKKRLW